jgi:hypothetical protein
VRRGAAAIDRVLAPIAEGVVQNDLVGAGYALLERGRRGVIGRTERTSRQILHAFNLPAASDVNRLLTQIALVEHRIREVRDELDDHDWRRKEVADADPSRGGRQQDQA